MRAQIKRLERIADAQKLVIEEKTKKESIDKQTQDWKANEFQTEFFKIKSENNKLEENVKHALSDIKEGKDKKIRISKTYKQAKKP